MEEKYSISEILNAVQELEKNKKTKKIEVKKIGSSNSEIPSNTLKLIEAAEKTIILKTQSE
tara:strand:- start:496 stop:678 length:183 start_codon:yes stop_codon:yes gene_type:complete